MVKLYLLLIFLLSSSNLPAQSDTTGWIDKGDYLEQKLTLPQIIFIKFSKDNQTIFTCSKDGILRRWQISTGKIIKELKIGNEPIYYFELGPDERKFISSNISFIENDSIINLHFISPRYPIGEDVNINTILSYTTFNPFSYDIIYQPCFELDKYNEKEMIVRFDFVGWFDVFSCYSPSVHKTYQNGTAKGLLTFSPNGKYISYCSYMATLSDSGDYYKSQLEIADINFVPKLILSKIYKDFHQYDHFYKLIWSTFSHNSKLLAYYNPYDDISINSVPDGKQLWSSKINTLKLANQEAIIFSKDNNNLIMGNYDINQKRSFLKVLNISSGNLFDSLYIPGQIDNWRFAYSKDFKYFASAGSDGKIRIFKGNFFDDLDAEFSADSTNVLIKSNIAFHSLSAGRPKIYLWDFGDSKTSNLQNPVHAYDSAGVYSIKLIVGNSLKYDTLVKNNYIKVVKPEPSDVPESSLSNNQYHFEYYPNPFNEKITFKYNLPVREHVTLSIYNVFGELIAELEDETKPLGEYTSELSTGANSSGVYYYKLQRGDSNQTGVIMSVK